MESSIDFIDSPDFRKLPRSILLADPFLETPRGVTAPPETPPYLAALYEFPLLSREQEFQLFRKMHYLRYLAAQTRKKLSLSNLNADRVTQIHDWLSQANEIRNQIINCNLRLVVSIAKTLVDSANSLDDLISEGNLPLLRAAEIFDFTRGLRFSTYATWAVRNGLYRVSNRNRKSRQRFRTDDPDWIDQTTPSAGETHQLTPEFDVSRLERMVRQLDARSQTIIRDRFGLGSNQPPAKFRELAAKLRLSSERVRQLLDRALCQLREHGEEALT